MTVDEIKAKIYSIFDSLPIIDLKSLRQDDIILIGNSWAYGYTENTNNNLRRVVRITPTQIKHLGVDDKQRTDKKPLVLTNKTVAKTKVKIRRLSCPEYDTIVSLLKIFTQAVERDETRTLRGNDRYVLWNYAFEVTRNGLDDLCGFVMEVFDGRGKLLSRVRMIALEANIVEGPCCEVTDPDEAMVLAYAALYRDEESIGRGNVFQIHYVPEMD